MLRYYLMIPFFVRLQSNPFFQVSFPKIKNITQIDTEWEDMIKKFGLCE